MIDESKNITKSIFILVATEEEKNILISKSFKNLQNINIIVTGIGQANVINAIKDYAPDYSIAINIGLSAGTKNVPKDTLIPIPIVMPGFNYGKHQKPISIYLNSKENAYPCVSAPGFITDIEQFFPESCYSPDYVVDMELYTIASYFNEVYAFKVVSDAGDFDDYLSALEDYDSLSPIRKQFFSIVSDLIKNI